MAIGLATRSTRDLEPARELVERTIGRPLRQAEQAIDVLRLDGELNRAKDDLEAAIRAEMLRAARAWVDGYAATVAVNVTEAMLEPLHRLVDLGREESLLELERLGYLPRVPLDLAARYFASAEPSPGRDRDLRAYLTRNLARLRVEIEDRLVTVDVGATARSIVETAILDAIGRIGGARDIASRIISTALVDGMAQTWDANADLVSGWEYTAVLDSATCDECEPLDGTTYPTWEEIQVVLPDGGPNPACLGEGRCRCRAVPLAA